LNSIIGLLNRTSRVVSWRIWEFGPMRTPAKQKIHVIWEADARVNEVPVASERSGIANALSDEEVSWFLALVASLSFVKGFRLRASRNEKAEDRERDRGPTGMSERVAVG
jgi:hypothetical protein